MCKFLSLVIWLHKLYIRTNNFYCHIMSNLNNCAAKKQFIMMCIFVQYDDAKNKKAWPVTRKLGIELEADRQADRQTDTMIMQNLTI